MDYDKYIKYDNGTYSVHFWNNAKLTAIEIRNIFSSYGKVLNIAGKEENGPRYIKYGDLQETINCVKGLWEDQTIKLLPEKSKINRSNYVDKIDSSLQQAVRTENSFQQRQTFNKGKQSNSNFICDENSSNIEKSWSSTRTSNQNVEPDNYQNSMHDRNLYPIKRNEVDSSVFNGKSLLPLKQQTSMKDNSSDITMDYTKYYRVAKDGTFTVHFSNRCGITVDKTKELFASYGHVVSVHTSGGGNGLVFIRYRTEDEVKRCIKGFQNSKEISILPQKDKLMSGVKNTDKKSWTNPWQMAMPEGTSEKVFDAGKQFNSNFNYNEKFSDHGEKPTSDGNKYGNTENFSDTSSSNSRQGWRSNANKIKHENVGPQMSNEKYSFLSQQNPIYNEDYNCVMREKQQESKSHPSIKTETETKLNRNMQVSTRDYKIPALISDTDVKAREFDTMSDSSGSSGKRNSSPKIVYIPMQEIIVANINTNYGVHYILHLFEKHNPISATFVKMIPETNIRYCHVYFKSMRDAITVEEEFDNFDLSGKNLIVLRKSQLIDEAM